MSATATTGGSSTPERVPLNLRVGKEVKETYEQCIAAEHGTTHPHAVTELERELRLRLERGTVDELYSSIESIAEAFGKAPPEKKNLSVPESETTVVRYRVAEPIKRGIESMMAEIDHSNPGAFVETVMHKYAIGESVDERLIDLTDRIKQATEYEFNDELGAKERRTKAIADELGAEFTLSEFRDAIESATKFSASRHNRNTYLPRVLDEKGCTWHPHKPDLFVPADDVPPADQRDPRCKPYLLMSDADKRTALKYELYQNANRIETADAVSVLQGKPNPTTVEQLMRTIGKTEGFRYRKASTRKADSDEDVLRLRDKSAAVTSPDHDNLQAVVAEDRADDPGSSGTDDEGVKNGTDADLDTETTGADDCNDLTDSELSNIVAELPPEIDNLPDIAIANKVVRQIQDIDHPDDVPENPESVVTDEQIAQVRQYTTDSTEQAGSNTSGGRGSTDETTTQHADIDADEQFDELNQATAVRADGGKPTT